MLITHVRNKVDVHQLYEKTLVSGSDLEQSHLIVFPSREIWTPFHIDAKRGFRPLPSQPLAHSLARGGNSNLHLLVMQGYHHDLGIQFECLEPVADGGMRKQNIGGTWHCPAVPRGVWIVAADMKNL